MILCTEHLLLGQNRLVLCVCVSFVAGLPAGLIHAGPFDTSHPQVHLQAPFEPRSSVAPGIGTRFNAPWSPRDHLLGMRSTEVEPEPLESVEPLDSIP